MKIALIGPGNLPIPPPGWGAIEIVIWDMYRYLKEIGHDVYIINIKNKDEIIKSVNDIKPDIVHLHSGYDSNYECFDNIDCKTKVITIHAPYQVLPEPLKNKNIFISTFSEDIKDNFIKDGIDKNRLFVTPNGIDEKKFIYSNSCSYPDRSIYLAVIEPRKNQYKYQSINSLYFVGNVYDNYHKKFDETNPRYLGWWPREYIYSELTNYANLVLLSESEGHSLAVSEALLCGLGVVISEACCRNLDLSKPWITIIPNDKLDDLDYIEQHIIKNREVSVKYRDEIIKHSLETISWKSRINNINNMYKLLTNIFSDLLLNNIVSQNNTELCDIMNRFGSDKGNGWHNYTKIYDFMFKNMRDKKLNILEIGVGTINPYMKSNMCLNNGYRPGSSHRGWKEYFYNSNIYGCDIDTSIVTNCDEDRIKYFYLDQLDLNTIKDQFYTGEFKDVTFDIIIDDGLHDFVVNYNLLKILLNRVNKDGYYIIEDIKHYNDNLIGSELNDEKYQYVNLFNIHNNCDNNLFIVKK